MVKILASLRNFRDRIRTSISLKFSNALFFLAILFLVILAIVIRLSPLVRGITLIKAFDPWIQWYNAEYLDTHTLYEYFNWVDYKSWYPDGYFRGGLRPGLTFTVVIIHQIFSFFGLPISLYDVCFYFPAFMGGITVLVMYFLGKEVLNKATGLFAAFFLAFNPGYLQRTTAGFFDNETIGVFATLMIFLFFLKALRTGRFSHSVIGGIFLGYLSLSWGGYQFVYLLIPIICIILILTNKYNENILISYAGVQGTGLLIFALYSKFNFETLFTSLNVGGIFLFTIILIIFHLINIKKREYPNFYDRLISLIKWAVIPIILIFAVLIWIAPELIPFGFGSRFQTLLSPLFREDVSLVASVAEQMPSAWSVFYYNTLIPLMLIPLGIYFCFKRLNPADILLIVFVILMYYFTGSMIRIILIFAPAAALAGAYGLASILKIFGSFVGERKTGISRKRRRQLKGTLGSSEALAVYLIVGILMYAQVAHTTDIAVNQMSFAQMMPGGIAHDWEESLTWMRNNLKGTDVVVSWWDYGYWLTPVGNVTTVNDNATKNQTRIGLTGMAFMQPNEMYSAKALRRLRADYILVYWGYLLTNLGGDEGKWTWMLQICNDNYEIYKNLGWEEDNWADNTVFDFSKYYNVTSGMVEPGWFQSQLCKLMFAAEPTTVEQAGENPNPLQRQLQENYAREINRRYDDNGNLWKSHIPDNGYYNTMVFYPEYVSLNGLVKLYKVDYTVLDSRFLIKNPEVFDSGYTTFKLKNTGTKELLITDVEVNGVNYNFAMGSGTKTIEGGSEDIVWVDTAAANFKKDDVAAINVTAQSEALYDQTYVFKNDTSNFFVKKALEGGVRINKENSIIIQKNPSAVDLYLEVENIGDSIVVLDRFYANNDTTENQFNQETIEYLSGSPILEPTDKSFILIQGATTSFYPIRKYNKIGVATVNDIVDELLFTSNVENYSLSILDDFRILSPEALATIKGNFRKHIPIDFNKSHAYTYDNGSTILKINIKNTGEVIFGLDSVYLNGVDAEHEVDFEDYYMKSGDLSLRSNEEDFIIIDATNYVSGDVNEEILICITGGFGTTVASDIGYIHTIRDQEDIQIIENVDSTLVSYISANETGRLLVKNTGNELITLDNVILNSSLTLDCSNPTEIEFLYGDSSLDIQECALLSFNIPTFKINKSDELVVTITTTTIAEYETTLNAIVETFYSISVDPSVTRIDLNEVKIKIINNGPLNVTIDSIYINNTYIPLNMFSFEEGTSWEIGNYGDSITIIMSVDDLKVLIGVDPLDVDANLIILARTVEGAEDTIEELVTN